MTIRTFALIGGLAVALGPVPAQAQSEPSRSGAVELIHKVGIHLNTSFRDTTDPDVTKGTTFGASIGLSPGRENGWTFPVGLTMFSEDLHSPNGETFAVMRTRAVMAGIGYGWHFGRLSTGATLQTGFALNRGR